MLSGRLYLIGMPGSGKSYFARKLAEHFLFPMVDLDAIVEEKENKTIAEIFEAYGEDYFRNAEFQTLKEISENNVDLIISTGGGTPCFYGAIDYMNQNGITIFLEVSKEVLLERLAKKADRPLMTGDLENKIDSLLENRLKFYRQAHISIDHREPDLLLQEIQKLRK